jgi:L-threonylcarbamoyladenylate synthase
VIDEQATRRLQACIEDGGVALFPADTVYGLACDPDDEAAVERLYALKGRPLEKPSAVLFGSLESALAELPRLGPRTLAAVRVLLPGAVTLLLPNQGARFRLACGADLDTLGVRVPAWPAQLSALAALKAPALQSSANLAGRPEARRLQEVDASIVDSVDAVLDGGELPGLASSVIDLRDWERGRRWRMVREGALSSERAESALA